MRDERSTSAPKFDQPCAIVSLKELGEAFTLARTGCPVGGCGRAIASHEIRVDASCVKVTFLCEKGHPTKWTSCEQIGRQMLVVNKLVPAASVMAGLKIVPMKRFMALLQVDTQNADHMKSTSIDLLAKITKDLYDELVDVVCVSMLEDDEFDCGIDSSLLSSLSLGYLIASSHYSAHGSVCSMFSFFSYG